MERGNLGVFFKGDLFFNILPRVSDYPFILGLVVGPVVFNESLNLSWSAFYSIRVNLGQLFLLVKCLSFYLGFIFGFSIMMRLRLMWFLQNEITDILFFLFLLVVEKRTFVFLSFVVGELENLIKFFFYWGNFLFDGFIFIHKIFHVFFGGVWLVL